MTNGVVYYHPTPAKPGFTFKSIQCSRDVNASMSEMFDISKLCDGCDPKTGKDKQGKFVGKFNFAGDWVCNQFVEHVSLPIRGYI